VENFLGCNFLDSLNRLPKTDFSSSLFTPEVLFTAVSLSYQRWFRQIQYYNPSYKFKFKFFINKSITNSADSCLYIYMYTSVLFIYSLQIFGYDSLWYNCSIVIIFFIFLVFPCFILLFVLVICAFFHISYVTSARSCNKVNHLFLFTILAQHETNDVILYIHSVHKHWGNTFQRLKPEKFKCLGNTIDGNIFNKHNDQEKKTLVKRIFLTCMEFIQFKLLCFNLIL
jgi:hypothetical protein